MQIRLCSHPGPRCFHLCPQLCLLSLRSLRLPSAAVDAQQQSGMLSVIGALSRSTHTGSRALPAIAPTPWCHCQCSVWVVGRAEEGSFENVNKSTLCGCGTSSPEASVGQDMLCGCRCEGAGGPERPGLWVWRTPCLLLTSLPCFADAISATNPRVIDDSRARKLSNDLKRCTYYETCATYGLNVERVFQDGNCSGWRCRGQAGSSAVPKRGRSMS